MKLCGGRDLDCRCSGFEFSEAISDAADGCQTDDNQDGGANLLFEFGFRGSLNVHDAYASQKILESCNSQLRERRCARKVNGAYLQL